MKGKGWENLKENVKGKLHNDKGFRGKKKNSQAVSDEKWIKF